MSYLSSAVISDIKADFQNYVDHGTAPTKLAYYYGLVATDFKSKLGSAFTGQPEAHFHLAFACLFVFEGWPYGGSTAFLLADCLAAPNLNCGNAPACAVQMWQAQWPSDGSVVDFVGWDYGPFGNHQQLLAYTPGYSPGMLFDPTIGAFVSGCSYDLLVAHYHFPAASISSWFSWDASNKTNIATFNGEVLAALANGTYSGSNTLFYTRTWAKMLTMPIEGYWRTPGTAVGGLQV